MSVPCDSERPERRVSRSSDPLTALSRLLDRARRETRIEAVAVADPSGLLVAGAGAAEACDELAAVAPLIARGSSPANDVVPNRLDVLSRRLEVRRVRIDGVEVLLSCQGEREGRELALERAAAGCQRILGRRPIA